MARNENPPFSRGETFNNGGTITADASTGLYGGYEHEGKIWEFEDLVYNQSGVVGSKQQRTNRMVKCMAVRNVSGIALLPSRLVSLQKGGTDGRFVLGRADGYSMAFAGSLVAVVDEWLPAAGVPDKDLFWAVVAGPTTVTTDPAGTTATNVFAVGDEIVALTAAASTSSTTSGRVAPYATALTSNTTFGVSYALNILGYALSAVTSGFTNGALLVNLKSLPWASD
jgi:hypothetical protein